MPTVKKTITLTQKQDDWIKEQIQNGAYTNESEYISDLLRKEEEKRSRFLETKAAIEKGLASGISERSLDDIWKQAEEEMRLKNA